MFSSILRPSMASLVRRVPAATRTSIRSFSGDSHAEHIKTMDTWRKFTFMTLPILGIVGVANIYIHMTHEHHEVEKKYAYNDIRKKKFPWQCDDCALFDRACHRKCKAEARAGN